MKRVILVISSVFTFGFWSEVFAESFGYSRPYSSHKIYGDYAYSVQRTSDVGYIVVGKTIWHKGFRSFSVLTGLFKGSRKLSTAGLV
jgi:hypothetical protein